MRTLIGLVIAFAIIITAKAKVQTLLQPYVLEQTSEGITMDWGRMVYDVADRYIDYLYSITADAAEQPIEEIESQGSSD